MRTHLQRDSSPFPHNPALLHPGPSFLEAGSNTWAGPGLTPRLPPCRIPFVRANIITAAVVKLGRNLAGGMDGLLNCTRIKPSGIAAYTHPPHPGKPRQIAYLPTCLATPYLETHRTIYMCFRDVCALASRSIRHVWDSKTAARRAACALDSQCGLGAHSLSDRLDDGWSYLQQG